MEKQLLKRILFISVPVLLCLAIWLIWPREEIDYNSQVKSIINAHCIQNGGFSLLFEEQQMVKPNPVLLQLYPVIQVKVK